MRWRRARHGCAAALTVGWALACARPVPLVPGANGASRLEAAHPYVVLVSFDAFRHDYLDRFPAPAFAQVAARGVRADALVPSFPSKTFPNHYTLVTGLYPGTHGIVGNSFYDPTWRAWYRSNEPSSVTDGRWYGGEPIWVTAEKNGVKSAVYFWPGSEAMIGGIRPSYWAAYDATVPNARRVNNTVAWLRLGGANRPHLALLYLSEVDDTTHKFGPDAAETPRAVASVDRALRQLLDSLDALPFRDSINVVLVSDHGMAEISAQRAIPVSDLLVRAGVDTTGILMSDNGPVLSLWIAGDSARVRRTRAVLDSGLGHARAYLRAETPTRWHVRANERAGDVLLVADDGYVLIRRATDRVTAHGAHGYDPAMPDMQGIFLAAGPGVRALGRIPAVENVNVYPFLAALLHLQRVPTVDGQSSRMAPLLR